LYSDINDYAADTVHKKKELDPEFRCFFDIMFHITTFINKELGKSFKIKPAFSPERKYQDLGECSVVLRESLDDGPIDGYVELAPLTYEELISAQGNQKDPYLIDIPHTVTDNLKVLVNLTIKLPKKEASTQFKVLLFVKFLPKNAIFICDPITVKRENRIVFSSNSKVVIKDSMTLTLHAVRIEILTFVYFHRI
jgi:hypothetical protein